MFIHMTNELTGQGVVIVHNLARRDGAAMRMQIRATSDWLSMRGSRGLRSSCGNGLLDQFLRLARVTRIR